MYCSVHSPLFHIAYTYIPLRYKFKKCKTVKVSDRANVDRVVTIAQETSAIQAARALGQQEVCLGGQTQPRGSET